MQSESSLFGFAVAILITAILLYGSYWAFSISRVRTSKLYKRQALSVGVVGLYFGILWIASPFTDQLAPRNTISFAISAVAFFAGAILIFVWIDGSMRVARRSDPIHRDTFHWKKLRFLIWALICFDILTLAVLYSQVARVVRGLTPSENIPFLALFLSVFLLAAPALFLAARRSRNPTLNRNLRWFALFVVFVLVYAEFGYFSFVLGASSGANNGAYLLISNAIGIVITLLPVIGAFSLYRSARSLAPIEQFLKKSSKQKDI